MTRAEHRRLHMTGKKYFFGKKLSAEHKEKLSKSRQKKVYCLELDKVFDGVRIAARELSIHATHITLCCQGKRKTCGGFHFEYYTGE